MSCHTRRTRGAAHHIIYECGRVASPRVCVMRDAAINRGLCGRLNMGTDIYIVCVCNKWIRSSRIARMIYIYIYYSRRAIGFILRSVENIMSLINYVRWNWRRHCAFIDRIYLKYKQKIFFFFNCNYKKFVIRGIKIYGLFHNGFQNAYASYAHMVYM